MSANAGVDAGSDVAGGAARGVDARLQLVQARDDHEVAPIVRCFAPQPPRRPIRQAAAGCWLRGSTRRNTLIGGAATPCHAPDVPVGDA
jgi:hypothetical protein